MSKSIAIIAGVGPGTGAAIARQFASNYPVVLLSRKPENYEPLVKELKDAGKDAFGVSTDVSDSSSVKSCIEAVKKQYGNDVKAAAAIYNASGGFVRKPFLELTEADLEGSWAGTVKGAFNFTQAVLPLLTPASASATPPKESHGPPTLIFTGATASVKGSANFSIFAAPKFAVRAMSQSLAREYGPKGVHVAHAIIDGVIDIPRTKEWALPEGGKIRPEGIAEAYWWLHGQDRTGVDLGGGLEAGNREVVRRE
ncbi:uncharacterized protein KY384_007885 [Bacidia gigantensis]|uniref:uncharacterized protein n=1 Tax=Bacidia gigantensis TaxID=2732470 RepID=UPI001D03A8D1|nr:uncharacterized protein KY384_007885 [Bacidia gigantensis]KAG8527731.1 hypothetical protein KY384_007885 [Bacidia gigantensis]